MSKKVLSILICLILVLFVLPIHLSAVTEDEQNRIEEQIEDTYWRTLSASGKSSLHGYCGAMAGWELYFLGITNEPLTYNGNDMYNVLSTTDQIKEGYTARCYPAYQYSLEEALNAVSSNGTEDVYNLMVGFQWTTTAAGRLYGHVTVIHAILDGMVYFTEGFTTPFQSNPSQAMISTIPEFAQYYDRWTGFEGLIYFGDGSRIHGCDTYGCEMFASATQTVTLYADVDLTVAARTLIPGERVRCTALIRNNNGTPVYYVEENGEAYFIGSDGLKPFIYTTEGLNVSDLVLPEYLTEGESFTLTGMLESTYSTIYNIVIEVTDSEGNVVIGRQALQNTKKIDLSTRSINQGVDMASLPAGNYTYTVYCDLQNYSSMGGELISNIHRVKIGSSDLTVGDGAAPRNLAVSKETVRTGWHYEDGKWYFYENAAPRIGWFCAEGVNYYFLEDGTAATGWQTVNGKLRYFSETGAMRIGWYHTPEGSYYFLSNGEMAVGTITVDGSVCSFAENGIYKGVSNETP